MPLILFRQVHRMRKITCLSANPDNSFEIKRKFVFIYCFIGRTISVSTVGTHTIGRGISFDESIKTGDIFELGVCVQQQSGVIRVGKSLVVQFLEVGREVVDPLGVKKLGRWLIEGKVRLMTTYFAHDVARL